MGQKIENLTLDILAGIIKAGNSDRNQKEAVLVQVSNQLDLLKILIRLVKDIKALDNKKYIQLESILQEIGKMIGGWLRSLH